MTIYLPASDRWVAVFFLSPIGVARPLRLREFYGTVEWAVRTIYSYHLGWFDGNATNLFPLFNSERAERMLGLAGGTGPLLAEGQRAAAALEALGEQQISANARNWYLTSVQWLRERARKN